MRRIFGKWSLSGFFHMTARSLRPFPVFFVRLMRGRPYWGCAGGAAVCALRCLAIGWAGGGRERTLAAERAFVDLGRRSVVEGWVVDRASGGHWLEDGRGTRGACARKLRPPSPPGTEPRPFDCEQPSTQGAVHLRRPCLAEWYFGSRDKAALARRFIYLSSSSLAAQVPPPSAGGALDAHLPEGVGASAQQFRAEARTPRYSCESTS